MANKRYAKFPSKGPPSKTAGPGRGSVDPIRTATWAGLPGKTQTKDRSAGIKKLKQAAASEGI
ncbi:unnamed protein product [marine sediment metagenome]|uniref:Uncharacterized protein n=1 Tax=marine sediment metagenome TaxID=412755 RepID=X0YY38_9ZZZZ